MTMKLQSFNTTKLAISASKRSVCSGELAQSSQGVPEVKLSGEEFVLKLLDRRWMLSSPSSKIQQIMLSSKKVKHRGELFGDLSLSNHNYPSLGPKMTVQDNQEPSFYIVRDDLLHPLVNGNKSRKLDALLPLVDDHLVTDVVTCGGCQSAHAAAVAVSCAERGIKSHLLLRGEQPQIQTGYNLISTMFGNVTYVPRSVYSNREKMLKCHADNVAGTNGHVLWFDDILEDSMNSNNSSLSVQKEDYISDHSRKVAIVNEGAGDVVALLGLIRLVRYLSQDCLFGKERRLKLLVDTGTGTTAVGLGLGALYLGLPWEITAVMLADTVDGYRQHEKRLISDFRRHFGFPLVESGLNETVDSVVHWVERCRPRKFGKILEGEIEACQEIARRTGILVDPIYTLAAWEMATILSVNEAKESTEVVMLHTGGTLGIFGLAQRYKSYFSKLKDIND